MAKKQSRRSISVSRTVYENLQTFSEQTGRPMSQITEDALRVAIAAGVDKMLANAVQARTNAASAAR